MQLTEKQILDKRLDYIFKCYTQNELASKIGITQWELLKKMQNDSFTSEEIISIEKVCNKLLLG